MLRHGLAAAAFVALAVTAGCSMCAHPYDWAGPMFVGMPRENCGPPPRAGSILDPCNHMVSRAPVAKPKPKKTAPASEGETTPPAAMPTTMPTTAAPKLQRPSAGQSPIVPVAEVDDSGWRAKRNEGSSSQ